MPEPQDFLNNEIIFSEITSENSINSNLFTSGRNFEILTTWITGLKTYLSYLQNAVDINKIFLSIVDKYKTQKSSILLSYTVGIGNTVSQVINNVEYLIKCVDQFTYEITNNTVNDWNVNNLIIQIKDANGTIIYAKITTLDKKITIVFDVPINIDTIMFFI